MWNQHPDLSRIFCDLDTHEQKLKRSASEDLICMIADLVNCRQSILNIVSVESTSGFTPHLCDLDTHEQKCGLLRNQTDLNLLFHAVSQRQLDLQCTIKWRHCDLLSKTISVWMKLGVRGPTLVCEVGPGPKRVV